MPTFSPKQLMPQRFIHHLASTSRRNQPKQFIPKPIVDGHIKFGHMFILYDSSLDC
jgi:hypothetical protein